MNKTRLSSFLTIFSEYLGSGFVVSSLLIHAVYIQYNIYLDIPPSAF